MSTPSKTDPLHPLARQGIGLFNQGKYYEAHEPLEEAWTLTASPERNLYQGLLQIGLAYFQITRGSYRGALKMFRRGHRNLDPLGDSLLGIDLDRLRKDARAVEATLHQLGPTRISQMDSALFKPVPENHQDRE